MTLFTPTRLGLDALNACLDLAEARKWPRETRTWGLLFALGRIYGVKTNGRHLAATVTTMRYGDRVATLGGLLVAPGQDGRGLGSFLTDFALSTVPAASTWLTATAQARPIYERLGFRSKGICRRYRGTLEHTAALSPSCRDVMASDLAAITTLDGLAFGADRERAIRTVFALPGRGVISICDGRIAGFALTWRSDSETVVGPLVAKNDAVSRDLLAYLAAAVVGPLRLELLLPSSGAVAEWLTSNGLRAEQDTEVMVRGEDLPGRRSWLVSPITRALG